MILKAKYVYPVSAPLLENGAIEVRESVITDVRRAARHETGASVLDCGDAVVLPGFVNAHTHLELTHLAGLVPPRRLEHAAVSGPVDFADWLRRLLGEMRSTRDDAEVIATSVNRGAALSLRAGVTTVGDITRLPNVTRPALRHGRLRVVSFGEVIAIGSLRDALHERLHAATDSSHDSERLVAAVSPHSPYTCDRRAISACKKAAADAKMRLCMHLAETRDEEACTLGGSGPLVDFLRSVGVWDESVKHPRLRPVEYAAQIGLLSPRTLLAHVNYVSDADLERIAGSGAHVAYCPRTHAEFAHPPHRFREMLARRTNVGIGTDSLASGPSLSILEELRFLRRAFDDFPADQGVDGDTLFEMGTLRGARALGMENAIGSLEAGKQADVVVVPLQPTGDCLPLENLLRSDLDPAQVYVGGCAYGRR